MQEIPETTTQKRIRKIEQLKARLEKEEGRLKDAARKERNGQLIAFGLYVEEAIKAADEDGRKKIEDNIKQYLNGRNLQRALAGIKRLTNA